MTDERLVAGRDYCDALERLGFPVQACLWTIPEERGVHSRVAAGLEGEFELGLVSSLIEREGPRKIYDLLWKAYDFAGTPGSLSPWSVCLYGSRSLFGRRVRNISLASHGVIHGFEFDGDALVDGATIVEKSIPMDEPWTSFAGRLTRNSWVYKIEFADRGNAADRRAIKTFARNIEKLAA